MKLVPTRLLLLISTYALAKDVHDNGYYRKDGTYVQPHIHSAPDRIKWEIDKVG